MSNPHDRFEALAGAFALGEATPDERARFEMHARECARCGEDAQETTQLRAFVETTRDTESWRPSMRDTIFARIHERRLGRSRFTIGALGWAFAASIVLNAAVVSGAAGSLGRALRDHEASSDVVASQIRLEAPRPAVVPTPVPLAPFSRDASRQRPAIARRTAIAFVRAPVASSETVRPPRRQPHARPHQSALRSAPAVRTGVDDILAGLDLAMARGLAAGPLARCDPTAATPVRPPQPCVTPRAEGGR